MIADSAMKKESSAPTAPLLPNTRAARRSSVRNGSLIDPKDSSTGSFFARPPAAWGAVYTSGGNQHGGRMHGTTTRATVFAVLAAGITLAGCKGKDTHATTDSTAATSMAAPDTSAMSASNGAVAAPLSDANIAGLVDEVNVADSTLAAAALPKLTSSGAKNFAKLMMGEHHGLHNKGLALEKAQKITPEVPAADPFKGAVGAEQSALAPLSKGNAYDSTYIANEVGIHQAVIDWQGKNTPQNAALKGYMDSAKGVYQKHLDEGMRVQKKLSGGKMS